MKVWSCGKYEDIEIGQKVLIASCGSGHSYFGEFAKLVKVTKQNLVFETESGAQVKTAIDDLHKVTGRAKKAGLWVSLQIEGRENDMDFIHQEINFWDDKKRCFVKK